MDKTEYEKRIEEYTAYRESRKLQPIDLESDECKALRTKFETVVKEIKQKYPNARKYQNEKYNYFSSVYDLTTSDIDFSDGRLYYLYHMLPKYINVLTEEQLTKERDLKTLPYTFKSMLEKYIVIFIPLQEYINEFPVHYVSLVLLALEVPYDVINKVYDSDKEEYEQFKFHCCPNNELHKVNIRVL